MDVLPDLLRSGLRVVFCGTASGNESTRKGDYYADPRNKFWCVLYDTGFTRRRLQPSEFRQVLEYRIGLTDIVKDFAGPDANLPSEAADSENLSQKVIQHAPDTLAFNGKEAASLFYGKPTDEVQYGEQSTLVGRTRVFVLPSTSGLAGKYWDVQHWHNLAKFLDSIDKP